MEVRGKEADNSVDILSLKESLSGIRELKAGDMRHLLNELLPYGDFKCLLKILHLDIDRCRCATLSDPFLDIHINMSLGQIYRWHRLPRYLKRFDFHTDGHEVT